jgi:hypothetical protein
MTAWPLVLALGLSTSASSGPARPATRVAVEVFSVGLPAGEDAGLRFARREAPLVEGRDPDPLSRWPHRPDLCRVDQGGAARSRRVAAALSGRTGPD